MNTDCGVPSVGTDKMALGVNLGPSCKGGGGGWSIGDKSHAMAPSLRFAGTWTIHYTVALYSLYVDGYTSMSFWSRPTASAAQHIVCGPLSFHRTIHNVIPVRKGPSVSKLNENILFRLDAL